MRAPIIIAMLWVVNSVSSKYKQQAVCIADDFTPSKEGLAGEFDKFLKDGYSNIRDGVPAVEPPTKNIVVMGWCGDIQDLVDSLTLFTPGKTIVNVLCNCCPEVYFQAYTVLEQAVQSVLPALLWHVYVLFTPCSKMAVSTSPGPTC